MQWGSKVKGPSAFSKTSPRECPVFKKGMLMSSIHEQAGTPTGKTTFHHSPGCSWVSTRKSVAVNNYTIINSYCAFERSFSWGGTAGYHRKGTRFIIRWPQIPLCVTFPAFRLGQIPPRLWASVLLSWGQSAAPPCPRLKLNVTKDDVIHSPSKPIETGRPPRWSRL